MSRLQKAGNWLRTEVREFEPDTILTTLGVLGAAAVLAFIPSTREAVAAGVDYVAEAVIDASGGHPPQPMTQEGFAFIDNGDRFANESERAVRLPDCVVLPDNRC